MIFENTPGTFDTIYWNIPWVHVQEDYNYENLIELGLFDPGYKNIERFLQLGRAFLKGDGRLIVGTSPDTSNIELFNKLVENNQYASKVIASGGYLSKEVPCKLELIELR